MLVGKLMPRVLVGELIPRVLMVGLLSRVLVGGLMLRVLLGRQQLDVEPTSPQMGGHWRLGFPGDVGLALGASVGATDRHLH